MDSTPASLLARLRHPGDPEAWSRFVHLYTPLLFQWANRLGLDEHDGSDLVQDVFAILIRQLPDFAYDPSKRFRGWLWTVTVHRARDQRRAAPPPATPIDTEQPTVNPFDGFVEAEYRDYVIQRALRLMRAEFEESTWRACWELVVNGRSGADAARDLGMSVGAVYVAKSRVLRRLRQELQGLLE